MYCTKLECPSYSSLYLHFATSYSQCEEFKPGRLVKYKNKLWVVKEIKVNGIIEIEASYSRRVKKVDRKLMKLCWCDEREKSTDVKKPDYA
ncbi:hypothetical protein LR48_Vigan03g076700 [Vigna angularis]|uniref:Uncharacterized protein n=1 Tax=Phaseolus angularis TaxID=3914 RepID=A0A0L9U3L7_PHAAN|nr:hypothetical protein LR48_Vigan03g076700 [Vigna angularis]